MRDRLGGLDLDKLVHERARLMILTYLASSDEAEVGFTELRDRLGFTAGNLSIQLKTLEEAGYLGLDKRYKDNKPYTGVRLTVAGERALAAYLEDLEVIVASLKAGGRDREGEAEGPKENANGAAGTV